MKKLANFSLMTTLFLGILMFTAACAQETSRTFPVKDFDKLDIGSAFTITVTQGSGYSVSARGRQKDIDEMEAVLKGSELRVGYKDKSWLMGKNHKNVFITITMPALKSAHFSGASTSKVSGFTSESMDIDVSGASTSDFKVNAKNVVIDCSGASNLTIIGNGDKMAADVSGASDLKAYDFKTSNAKIEASGASDAGITVSGNLIANASGASSINYKGSPSVTKSSSGASSIHGN